MAPFRNSDQRWSNCLYERAVQTEGRKHESCAYNREDLEAQKLVQAKGRKPESCTKRKDAEAWIQHNADNTTEPIIVTNPVVMVNKINENNFLSETINKGSNTLFSDMIINQSFVQQQLREEEKTSNVKQTSDRDNNNSESCISDQSKDHETEAQSIQTKKKRKQKIKKKNSKVYI